MLDCYFAEKKEHIRGKRFLYMVSNAKKEEKRKGNKKKIIFLATIVKLPGIAYGIIAHKTSR